MYFMHLPLSIYYMWTKIDNNSVYFVLGLTLRRKYSLSLCCKFSIRVRPGDSAGVFHQLILLSLIHCCAYPDVCLESLSCMNLWLLGYISLTNGSSVPSRISTNNSFFVMPSSTHFPVLPLLLIPAHTWIFVGCFGLCMDVHVQIKY